MSRKTLDDLSRLGGPLGELYASLHDDPVQDLALLPDVLDGVLDVENVGGAVPSLVTEIPILPELEVESVIHVLGPFGLDNDRPLLNATLSSAVGGSTVEIHAYHPTTVLRQHRDSSQLFEQTRQRLGRIGLAMIDLAVRDHWGQKILRGPDKPNGADSLLTIECTDQVALVVVPPVRIGVIHLLKDCTLNFSDLLVLVGARADNPDLDSSPKKKSQVRAGHPGITNPESGLKRQREDGLKDRAHLRHPASVLLHPLLVEEPILVEPERPCDRDHDAESNDKTDVFARNEHVGGSQCVSEPVHKHSLAEELCVGFRQTLEGPVDAQIPERRCGDEPDDEVDPRIDAVGLLNRVGQAVNPVDEEKIGENHLRSAFRKKFSNFARFRACW